jgi:hypothetical protein
MVQARISTALTASVVSTENFCFFNGFLPYVLKINFTKTIPPEYPSGWFVYSGLTLRLFCAFHFAITLLLRLFIKPQQFLRLVFGHSKFPGCEI